MIRKLFIALSLVFTACLVHAQTAISASDVSDSFDRPIASANLCFLPVDATGTATGFRVGSTQVVDTPVCGLVSNGVLQSGLSVVPTPTGIYYHITAVNRSSNAVIRDYGMTQITGSSWTLDTYDPSTAVLPVSAITMGTVTTLSPGSAAYCSLSGGSPLLLNCGIPSGQPINWVGAWAPTTAYTVGEGFTEGSTGYIVTTAYTSGGTFGSTDASNTAEIYTTILSGGPGIALSPSGGPGDVSINPVDTVTPSGDIWCSTPINTCIANAESYIGNGNAGADKSVTVHISPGATITSGPLALISGMTLTATAPARFINNNNSWGPGAEPNGGSWIDCGGNPCFNTAGSDATNGTSNISMTGGLGFKNWSGYIFQAGTSSNTGVDFGDFHDLYAIGNATVNSSDKGFVFYNSQNLDLQNINIINVNTGWATLAGGTHVIPGNTRLAEVYVFTYGKSVANGNSTEPCAEIQTNLNRGSALQCNTYAGDGTGIGILLDGAGAVHNRLTGLDMELTDGLYGVADESGSGSNLIEDTYAGTFYLGAGVTDTLIASPGAFATLTVAAGNGQASTCIGSWQMTTPGYGCGVMAGYGNQPNGSTGSYIATGTAFFQNIFSPSGYLGIQPTGTNPVSIGNGAWTTIFNGGGYHPQPDGTLYNGYLGHAWSNAEEQNDCIENYATTRSDACLQAFYVTAPRTIQLPDASGTLGFGNVIATIISGTSSPSATCSSTVNTWAIEINATPTAYQCSNATGSYAWNALGGEANITGLRYGNGTGADTAATGAQLEAVIATSLPTATSGASSSFNSGSNLTMSSTSTYYDGPTTGSLAAGTYFVTETLTLGKASATAPAYALCKLWDGTTAFATAQPGMPYVTSAAITYTTVTLSAVVTESGTSTIKVSCEPQTGSEVMYYTTPTGTLSNAATISWLRLQ